MTEFLLPSRCWILWDKKVPEGVDFSDGELAWTSFDKVLRIAKIDYSGFRGTDIGGKIHPTQKPVALYKWLLKNYAKEGDKILDTHLGSGSIGIACHYMGYELTGCELDKEYFDSAMERIKNQTTQQTLL